MTLVELVVVVEAAKTSKYTLDSMKNMKNCVCISLSPYEHGKLVVIVVTISTIITTITVVVAAIAKPFSQSPHLQ